ASLVLALLRERGQQLLVQARGLRENLGSEGGDAIRVGARALDEPRAPQVDPCPAYAVVKRPLTRGYPSGTFLLREIECGFKRRDDLVLVIFRPIIHELQYRQMQMCPRWYR